MGAAMLKGSVWPPEMKMLDPIVNALMFFEQGIPTVEDVASCFEKHLWPCHKISSCAEDGEFVCKHKAMDRAYHFSSQEVADEAAVDAFAQSKMCEKLDPSWPLWKVYLLTCQRGRSAMLVRMHHVIGDGLGIIFASAPMLDAGPGVDPLSTIPLPAALLPPSSRKPSTKTEAQEKPGCCKESCMFMKGLAVPVTVKPDSELCINEPLATRTPFLVYNSNRVYTRFPAVPMSAVKAVREKSGCSVNDALMAGLTGALRRYGAEVRGDERLRGETSGSLDFKCMMMMGLPRQVDEEDMTSALVNKILFASCPLPIDEPTAQGRLERMVATTGNLKSFGFMAGLAGITNFATGVLPSTLQAKLGSETFSKHSLLVTCVPSMTVPTSFPKGYGSSQRLSEMHMVFPNCIPQISIISYNGSVFANIVADPALYPNPERLGQLWVAEFAELAA